MSISILNNSQNLVILDGIEISVGSQYVLQYYEEDKILSSRQLKKLLALNPLDVHLLDSDFPLNSFSGIHAVSSIQDQRASNKNIFYNPIEQALQFSSQARPWERINLSGADALPTNASPPTYGMIRDSGLAYVDKGLEFNKDEKHYGAIASHNVFTFHRQSFSIGFWITPYEPDSYILAKENEVWAIELKGQHLKIDLDRNGSLKSSKPLKWKQRNCVVVVLQDDGKRCKAKLYLNGVLDESATFNHRISDLDNGNIYIGCEKPGSHHFDGILDELRFWKSALTEQQHDLFYASGSGTKVPILGSDELVAYHMNEGTGSIVAPNAGSSVPQLQLYGTVLPKWIDGLLINTGAAHGGVSVPWFSKDQEQELSFQHIFSNSYTPDSDLFLSFCGSPEGTGVGNVCLGLEFLWVNEGDVLPVTEIITKIISFTSGDVSYQSFSLGKIPGLGKKEGSLFSIRFFRDVDSIQDTYPARLGFYSLSLRYSKSFLGRL